MYDHMANERTVRGNCALRNGCMGCIRTSDVTLQYSIALSICMCVCVCSHGVITSDDIDMVTPNISCDIATTEDIIGVYLFCALAYHFQSLIIC